MTCLCQYSLPFLSFVFYRGFTIYIPKEPSHKGMVTQCSPINSGVYIFRCGTVIPSPNVK